MLRKRTMTVMGDGGFWHNGLTSGIANAVFNKNDGILVIMKNGYSSATGMQVIPFTSGNGATAPRHRTWSARSPAWASIGCAPSAPTWSATMLATLRKAMTHRREGPEGHHRRGRMPAGTAAPRAPADAARRSSAGKRVVRARFGVDEEVCTGDHSCIRLSGCPSLTVKDNPDPLRRDPVAHVIDGCVGCGLCGEVARRRGPLPVLLSSRHRAQRDLVGPLAGEGAERGVIGWRERRSGGREALAGTTAAPFGTTRNEAHHGPDRGPGRRGRRLLTDWIIPAAHSQGLGVQATQIPGVAQRTGATTYYLEVIPKRPRARLVLALNPAIGEVDVALATELLEAGRMIFNGFVSPDRTTLIASTHRVLAIARARGNGRRQLRCRPPAARRGRNAAGRRSCSTWTRRRRKAAGVINAVLLGALAGSGKLPIPDSAFELAIFGEGGKAVDTNLAAFAFGRGHARGELEQAVREHRNRQTAAQGARGFDRTRPHELPGGKPSTWSRRATAASPPIRTAATPRCLLDRRPALDAATSCARWRATSRCACRTRT